MKERGTARHGYPILDETGNRVGEVTSGAIGPTVGVNVGMGYVPTAMAEAGTRLVIDCRGKNAAAEVVKGPFYKRK
jgi:aminomethyltransferase